MKDLGFNFLYDYFALKDFERTRDKVRGEFVLRIYYKKRRKMTILGLWGGGISWWPLSMTLRSIPNRIFKPNYQMIKTN